jgi:hypothetical protein
VVLFLSLADQAPSTCGTNLPLTSQDIQKMSVNIKKNNEQEVKEKVWERKKEDQVAKKKAEQEVKQKEKEWNHIFIHTTHTHNRYSAQQVCMDCQSGGVGAGQLFQIGHQGHALQSLRESPCPRSSMAWHVSFSTFFTNSPSCLINTLLVGELP